MFKEILTKIYNSIKTFQDYVLLIWELFKQIPNIFRIKKEILSEMYLIGAQSFPIILLGGLFLGIIFSLEVGRRFVLFGAKTLVGSTVSLGLVSELGPVICGLLLSARTGAKNASELGTMRITEQIDALEAFGISPVEKLVLPRTIASVIMFLPLTAIGVFAGILSGMFVSNLWLSIDTSFFWHSAIYTLKMSDLLIGFTKPIIFGFFIATISCFYGLNANGGNRGLGRATINAVVTSSIIILFIDFIFTKIILEIL